MKRCLIITGGDYSSLPDFINYDYCIACDRGYEYARRMDIVPDVVMGDFDSASDSMMKELEEHKDEIPVFRFPVEKDDTDTMLAIKHAISLGYRHIILNSCLGGQMDHTIANIQSMHYAASHGCICETFSGGEWMRTVTPSDGIVRLQKRDGYGVSLFSLTSECGNLTIAGAKYNASGIALTSDFPLGHGNSWSEDEISISIGSGIMLVAESKKN